MIQKARKEVIAVTAAFTAHALKRMGQRNIPRWQVDLALSYGKRIYAHKSLFVFLGRRHIERMRRDGYTRIDKLEGLTLVLDPKTKALITCFKNRSFTRKIRHKD